jgi:hypothetical protein
MNRSCLGFLLLQIFFFAFISFMTPASVQALTGNQLIMVTASDCPWCEAFEEEVGKGYPKTDEAKFLPMRRHDIYDAMPEDMKELVPPTMTPTFIIVMDGKEVGRIVGYPGQELFWWRLSEFTR